MLIVALAVVLTALAWLVIKRMQHADPAARGARFLCVIACLGAALALRVGLAAPVLLRVALYLLATSALEIAKVVSAACAYGRGQAASGTPEVSYAMGITPALRSLSKVVRIN
jgi:hypothetical protein